MNISFVIIIREGVKLCNHKSVIAYSRFRYGKRQI